VPLAEAFVCRACLPDRTLTRISLALHPGYKNAVMPSPVFERFRWSFFEDPDSPRNGLDAIALRELVGDERAEAEDMLIDYLPDTRGVIGLGVLRSRKAEALLVPLFDDERREQGNGLTYLAKALWQIRPDPRWMTALIDVLRSSDDHIQRMHAAIALREVRDPAAVRALTAALDDPESLVRHHAAGALLAIHGLPVDSMDTQHMTYRVMSDDPARREGGKRDILAAIAERDISSQ
jgi:hypothetical protein